MEVFRESVARIFKEGSAETMIKFLEHCWLHRTPDVAKPLSAAYTAGRCAAEQAVSEALPWLDGGPCDMPEWDPLVLWVCPTRCLLDAIAHQVRGAGLCSVTSLGSGTGLLEWLLAECSGLEVTSLEVNRSWWESSYAPPTFVKHVYTDEIHGDDDEQHGSTEVYEIPPTDAFMTCYFNNADVFRYLARYQGPLLLIIGSEGGSVVTRPGPLDYTQQKSWRLCHTLSLGPAPGRDLLAVYVRRTSF